MRPEPVDRLRDMLAPMGGVAVAVSGGVDSLTLAYLAHRVLGERATMYHAVSPAVPDEATRRTRRLADVHGWDLHLVEAGEFADPRYRANPVNRCFFCKSNLYGAISRCTGAQILSGTNLDDLGEYRPGLDAAREHGVRHPFVESGIDKAMVREIAAELGLGSIADLPAAPCLSSRVETGIAIEARILAVIHGAEQLVRGCVAPRTVRCRVRSEGVVLELDVEALAALEPGVAASIREQVLVLAGTAGVGGPVAFAAYRNGSAFLRD